MCNIPNTAGTVQQIEPNLYTIGNYLKLANNNTHFVIPEYQRAYSWTTEQCDKLWEDIETYINNSPNADNNAPDPYFFGTVIADCSEPGKLNLIDGQQRTTTFILLLKALLMRINKELTGFREDDDNVEEWLIDLLTALRELQSSLITILYNIGQLRVRAFRISKTIQSYIENNQDYNFTPIISSNSINEQYGDDLRNILLFNTKDDLNTQRTIIPNRRGENRFTNFYKNFKYFYDKIDSFKVAELYNFANVILNKCQIILIKCWNFNQAINMFNSLNSTGLPLNDADIISAKLFTNADVSNKNKFNEMWSATKILSDSLKDSISIDLDSILQQYMYIERARENRAAVQTIALRTYYTVQRRDLLTQPEIFTFNLFALSSFWSIIKNTPVIKSLLESNHNAKYFLATFLSRFIPDYNNLTDEEKNDYTLYDFETSINNNRDDITTISEVLLRLFALLKLTELSYSTQYFKVFFFNQLSNLANPNIPVSNIKQSFNDHIKKNWQCAEIEDSIKISKEKSLVYINEYLYAKHNNIDFVIDDSVNIEHIMPQSGRNRDAIRNDAGFSDIDEFNSYIDKIGNKILLEAEINKSLSNDWFKTKKSSDIKQRAGYINSQYPLSLALVNYPKDTWTKEDIDVATKKATKRITNFIFDLPHSEVEEQS